MVPVPTTTEFPGGGVEDIYDGCGDVKLCFGLPSNCLDTRNCDLFGAVIHESGIFRFEMFSIRKLIRIFN